MFDRVMAIGRISVVGVTGYAKADVARCHWAVVALCTPEFREGGLPDARLVGALIALEADVPAQLLICNFLPVTLLANRKARRKKRAGHRADAIEIDY